MHRRSLVYLAYLVGHRAVIWGLGLGLGLLGCSKASEAPPSPKTVASQPSEVRTSTASASAPSTGSKRRFTVDPRGFRQAMLQYRADFRKCYDAGVARGLDLKGRMKVKFSLVQPSDPNAKTAKIQEARIAHPTPDDPELRACAVKVVHRLTFEVPEDPLVRVVYPFRFNVP